jgi:signal transduction histidine kinase
MIGQPLQILFPNDPEILATSQKESPTQNLEITARSRNGQSIRVDLTQSQIDQTNENAPISLLIMRDVTFRSERLAIIEEERARIARDLHDSVAQTLYFLAIKAQMVDQQYHSNQKEAKKTLQEMGREARRAIRDIRRAIFGLRPLDWSEKGFLVSLKEFLEDFTGQIGWQVDISLDPNLAIPSRLEPTIFRIVQESLNNAAKHANAGNIAISIQEDETRQLLSVKIVDDGDGFDVKDVKRGLGIEQMENRVKSANGKFLLQSQPGTGTEILAEIPISGSSNERHSNTSRG